MMTSLFRSLVNSVSKQSSHLTHPKYRPDIDGLRAIAVLSVVIYHAFPDFIKGGFIGVDIFFVISGFLISTIIIDSLEKGTFSFIEFYSRRVKRIFPALILVLTFTLILGWFVLFADEYKQLGKHIKHAALFYSNFILWKESSYFDVAAETKPLLHLWSLAIEEQFYIVWPLLLWAALKKRFNLFTITIVIALISFKLNISKSHYDMVADFYSPQTRFWELLLGSILAYIKLRQWQLPRNFKCVLDGWLGKLIYNPPPSENNGETLRDVQAIVGALLLLIGVLVIKKEQFPGWSALLPTCGALLIISAGMHAWFNRRILANHILVWFGLISFPLYLWHWVLLSFARIVQSETPAWQIRISAVLLSIVLAWLTYRFIEKPLRFGLHDKAKTITLLILMVVIGYTGAYIKGKEGLPDRSAANKQIINIGDIGVYDFFKYHHKNFFLCTPLNIQKEASPCFQSKNNDVKTIALIGDSHAQHLFLGLAEKLTNINIVDYSKHASPYIGNKEFETIFNYVINNSQIKTIIISAYWEIRKKQIPQNSSFESELSKTVTALTKANKKVYIVDDIPNFSFSPKKCQSVRKFSIKKCSEDRNFFYNQYKSYFPIFEAVAAKNKNVKILKIADYFCDDKICTMARDGVLFYRDEHHLNINGSKLVGQKIVADNPELAN